ncbi:MAG: peptide deformylase [Halanaerobiales bacterium]
MALLKIRKVGDPVLRSKARPVNTINNKTKTLLDNMAKTMYKNDGIGLAAPQVGVLQRMFIVDIGDGLLEFINPEITSGEGKNIMEEGCLSVPEKTGGVIRAKKITIKALNRNGNEIEMEADGLLARALQHENDHLDGILFIDKMVTEEELSKMENKQN